MNNVNKDNKLTTLVKINEIIVYNNYKKCL